MVKGRQQERIHTNCPAPSSKEEGRGYTRFYFCASSATPLSIPQTYPPCAACFVDAIIGRHSLEG